MKHMWDHITEIYSNARTANSYVDEPINYEPVKKFISVCDSFWRQINNPEVKENAREAQWAFWKLKNNILYSLRPFDYRKVILEKLLDQIKPVLQIKPGATDIFHELQEIISWLFKEPYNPKHQSILQIASNQLEEEAHHPVGIVAPKLWSLLSGWNADYIESFSQPGVEVKLIPSKTDLDKNLWSLLLIPFGTYNDPFIDTLLSSYLASEVRFIRYQQEPRYTYEPLSFPKLNASASADSGFIKSHQTRRKSIEEDMLEQMFWERWRHSAARKNADIDETGQELVSARLVILTERQKWGVYLQSDKKELTGNLDNILADEKVFSYKTIDNIQAGDYIFFRTGRDADLLEAEADKMMIADGKYDSCKDSFDWKEMLKEALENYEVEYLVELLASKGVNVEPPQYIFNWAGNVVMCPRTQQRFAALMEVISEAGAFKSELELSPFIRTRWSTMQTYIKYRRSAGHHISKSLKNELQKALESGETVGDEYKVTLGNDLSGAELTLFKISCIASEDEKILQGRAGKLFTLEEDLFI